MVKNTDNIPKTGRIGRFAKILEKEVSREVMLKVLQGSDKYNSLNSSEKAEWWKDAIKRLEHEIGMEKSINIMKICGDKCCGAGHRKTVKKKYIESKSLEEFLDKISIKDVTYKLEDDNTIVAEYKRCFCGNVKNAKKTFPDMLYCECGKEFNKIYFSSAFGKDVEVKLISSVISGSDSCKFLIRI
jgi:hypothetical protein